MDNVLISVGKLVIPTYAEPAPEELPMFAENRVHQRSSGNPYPNKVVMEVDRREKIGKEYTVVILENEYVKIEILPEIGGRVYSAFDKTAGVDMFYKQHVIKPALIGALGSWVSGGIEFNWPFHHRASGFMACDFTTEILEDGSAVCWLSEHEPMDRMKGMVGIVLRPGESFFETRMRLYNRTDTEHSFLWWENTAVAVNENYQIFFPQDVSYVNFHYLKSRTTYPIAGNGVFNGIPMEEPRDISWHKNTREATSYFAAASDYDFFGGYDHGKESGVVHVADHHVSPGKKMFTWAYNQLSKSWENALTDTDGQYAELMAGSYSDNQPDFSWLAPYETKEFSQYWYPIAKIGTPTFANLHCAFKVDREKGEFTIQSTAKYENANIRIFDENGVYLEKVCDLLPENPLKFAVGNLPRYVTVSVTCDGEEVAEYTEQNFDKFNMPDVITDMPSAASMNSPQELYLAGVHVDQYRDPAVKADAYWKEALKRDITHIPSLIAMAKFEYNQYNYAEAEGYITRAIAQLDRFNARHQSGEAYYTYGKILEAKGQWKKAHDFYNKAAWAADSVVKAMTRIAVLDLKLGHAKEALRHAKAALDRDSNDALAAAAAVLAARDLGKDANELAQTMLRKDPMDHMMRYLTGAEDFYTIMDSDPAQTCLDLAFDFAAMGREELAVDILEGLVKARPECANQMVFYTLAYYKGGDFAAAENAPLGRTYPFRREEQKILEAVGSDNAKMLLGCLLYNRRHYAEAAGLWEGCKDYISRRNLAVAYFSHLGRGEEALAMMKALVEERPTDHQLLFETIWLMNKLCTDPAEKIKLILAHPCNRDDVITELSKAYNQALQPEKALEVLKSHNFVPCEGGEHAIADQYMFAYLVKGKIAMEQGDAEKALELFREGQILPQSTGAGVWNHCKRIPLRYHEACCLEALGKQAEADEIFSYIANVTIEYFSNMHLKELPYYQAMAWNHLGQPLKGQHLITKYVRSWTDIETVKDNGFFQTTPFFISFVDEPVHLRKAHHLYLNALCHAYMETGGAEEMMAESLRLNNETMFATFFHKFGFLK